MKLRQFLPKIWQKFDSVESTCYYVSNLNGRNFIAIESTMPVKHNFFKKTMTVGFNTYVIDPMLEQFLKYYSKECEQLEDYQWHIPDMVQEKARTWISNSMQEHLHEVYDKIESEDKPTYDEFIRPILKDLNAQLYLDTGIFEEPTLKAFYESGYEFLYIIPNDSYTKTYALAKMSSEGYVIIRYVTVIKMKKANVISTVNTFALNFTTISKLVEHITQEEIK